MSGQVTLQSEPMAAKLCTRCGESKPAAVFCKSKRGADGLGAECRDCANARQRDRRVRVRNMEPVEVDPRRTFYSGAETANICDRSERWVYRQVDADVLVAAERGRGVPLRITAKSLRAHLESTGAL
jgi:hypothetical protein